MYAHPTNLDPDSGRPVLLREILAQSHTAYTYAQLEDWQGNVLKQFVDILGGSVSVDSDSQVRRSLSAELSPQNDFAASIIPVNAGDPYTPYGNRLRIWRGTSWPGGMSYVWGQDTYLWTIGVFRLSTVEVADDGQQTLKVTGYDASRTVSRNRLTQPWVVAPSTNWGDAIFALVADRAPGSELAGPHGITEVSPATAVVIDPEADPWTTAQDWAAALGRVIYFDATGKLKIEPEPDPATSPVVWDYSDAGTDQNATLLSVQRSMTDEPGYNGVVVTSESTTIEAPVRGEAWDDNPSSPTYHLGGYGKVPKFITSPYVTTQAQAEAMAKAELLRVLGGTEQLSFATVPNPTHEAGDVVRVKRPLSGIDRISVLKSFSIPLAATEAMTIQTVERRTLV